MAFPIIGGSQSGGYLIDNSLRFNDGDSASLTKTFSGDGNRKTFTWSGWVKKGNNGLNEILFASADTDNTPQTIFNFDSADRLSFFDSTSNAEVNTNNLFRDVSAWYHILLSVDTTQSTASNRIRFYVNGNEVSYNTTTYPSQNTDFSINDATYEHEIGGRPANNLYFDGYMAEVHFIDGTAKSPTDFGEFDEDSGVWKPIQYTGSYGTNGFYLDFSNSSTLGEDFSGNDNDFTATNLASTDQTTDTPTNNFATLNANMATNSTMTLAEGNLEGKTGSNYANGASNSWFSTMGVSTGKWYTEFKLTAVSGSTAGMVGVGYNLSKHQQGGTSGAYALSDISEGYGYLMEGNVKNNGSNLSGTWNTYTTNDIIGIALDLDNNRLYFSKNGTFENSADPTDGTNAISITGDKEYFFAISDASLGNTYTYSANFGSPAFSISSGNSDDNGYGNFEYAPPSGYLALCTQNLATELSPTIDDGSDYFNTILYTGTGSSQSITGVGFQPDWTWIKCRNTTRDHTLTDSTRGATKTLVSNTSGSESTDSTGLTSFDSDGFTLGGANAFNANTETHVAWNWLANGGTTSSNTDGSITSTVQANTTAGFSIVTYTGNNTANATVGHGLGVTPDVIIVKNRSGSNGWRVMHQDLDSGKTLYLETTDTQTTDSARTDLTSSTVFTLTNTSAGINASSNNYVAYCFAEIEGYSKFGSYIGNGSTDGTFVYTGFRPSWVMIKVIDTTEDWWILDTTRDTFNSARRMLYADGSSSELNVNEEIDFLSNGFKLRRSTTGRNGSGNDYIYMAFAENPFVTSGAVPVTAR